MINHERVEDSLSRRRITKPLRIGLAHLFHSSVGMRLGASRGTKRHPASKTQEDRLLMVGKVFEELHDLNYKLEKPQNLSEKHIQVLVHHWVAKGQTAPTIDNKLSSLRWATTAMRKQGLVKRLEEYVPAGYEVKRSRITVSDKTFTGNGLDPNDVIEKLFDLHAHVGCVSLLQNEFALRVQEAWQLRCTVNGGHFRFKQPVPLS